MNRSIHHGGSAGQAPDHTCLGPHAWSRTRVAPIRPALPCVAHVEGVGRKRTCPEPWPMPVLARLARTDCSRDRRRPRQRIAEGSSLFVSAGPSVPRRPVMPPIATRTKSRPVRILREHAPLSSPSDPDRQRRQGMLRSSLTWSRGAGGSVGTDRWPTSRERRPAAAPAGHGNSASCPVSSVPRPSRRPSFPSPPCAVASSAGGRR